MRGKKLIVIAAFAGLGAGLGLVPSSLAHVTARYCWPGFSLPAVHLPAVHIPATTIPATTIPATTIPATTIPRTCFAGTCYPAQHIPAQHIPAQHIPAQHIPAQHIPAQTIPASHVPGTCVNTSSVFAPSQTSIRVRNYDGLDTHYSPRLTQSYWNAAGPYSSYPDPLASGFGVFNAAGFPKNQYVRSYVRRDGTFVSGYWRNSPSDGLPTCSIIHC
jgi:hypothetical protein